MHFLIILFEFLRVDRCLDGSRKFFLLFFVNQLNKASIMDSYLDADKKIPSFFHFDISIIIYTSK